MEYKYDNSHQPIIIKFFDGIIDSLILYDLAPGISAKEKKQVSITIRLPKHKYKKVIDGLSIFGSSREKSSVYYCNVLFKFKRKLWY